MVKQDTGVRIVPASILDSLEDRRNKQQLDKDNTSSENDIDKSFNYSFYEYDIFADNAFIPRCEGKRGVPQVKGRLKANMQYWKCIGANEKVLSIIEQGYKIPFIDTPNPVIFPRVTKCPSDCICQIVVGVV